jgi:hypothetical protein
MFDRWRHSDRMFVFIDESGDPGFKLSKGSASAFVAVLIAFHDKEAARQTQTAIDQLARRLPLWGELKFSKSRSEVRDSFFAALQQFNFRARARAESQREFPISA